MAVEGGSVLEGDLEQSSERRGQEFGRQAEPGWDSVRRGEIDVDEAVDDAGKVQGDREGFLVAGATQLLVPVRSSYHHCSGAGQ